MSKPNLTAAQRLEGLEQAVTTLDGALRNIVNTVDMLHQAIKILGNKTDAIVKATNRGAEMTDETISAIMVENNVTELKQKVTDMVTTGLLVQSEIVEEQSFIVGREIDPDTKKVANPRIQIGMSSLTQAAKDMMLGKKTGETVDFGNGKLSIELEEVYRIVTPDQQVQPQV